LDNLKPENNSNVIESKVFTFENVPVNASFHSCIQRLIYPNVTLCDNFGSRNHQGPTIEQLMLPFFGVNPANAQDDEGYTICAQYLTEVIPKLVYLAITAGMKTIERIRSPWSSSSIYHVVLMIDLIPVERTKF
jgi:hypothetical protein